jgi:acyl-homoserine-lactone acylase
LQPHRRAFVRLLPGILLLSACAPLQRWLPTGVPADERMGRSVTIVRDEWGVPAVYGPTDAAVAFGIAYAQAEDDFRQIEEDYIHALGWASWYYGERYIADDLVRAAFDVVRLAQEEYEREPPDRRALWDAWAAGLNWYLRSTGTAPRFIARWEPWMVLARVRAADGATVIDGIAPGEVVSAAQHFTHGGAAPQADVGAVAPAASAHSPLAPFAGSLVWAIAPSRSASGRALLMQNVHGSFQGDDQAYELLVHSESGWHVRGVALLGTPVPRAGHTAHHGWAHTAGSADHADAYAVVFDHPSDPLLYRYDGEWRRATEREHVLRVNTAAGVEQRSYRLRNTHHGPIVAVRGDTAFAVRIARMQEGGSLQQSYALGRAAGLDEFRAALAQNALRAGTVYADADGSIHYVHTGAVPRRDASIDWTRPVSGNTAATEWQGWHALDELPQLLNPPGGWLQATGSSPLVAVGGDSPLDRMRFPAYMLAAHDDARAQSALRLLAGTGAWTLDELAGAAFDTHVAATDDVFAALVREWEGVGGLQPRRAMALDEAVDMLRVWDRSAGIESVEMTLFVLWQERLRSGSYDGADRHFRALEDAVDRLRADFGTLRIAWGELNRHQRVEPGDGHDAEATSHAVAGAPAWAGTLFSFRAEQGPGGRRFGTAGTAWVGAVELGPQPQARAVAHYGQSADPRSPHFFDQAPLYARGELRAAPFARDDVMRSSHRVYQPGIAQAAQ